MTSFFDKLKKGMGMEAEVDEQEVKELAAKPVKEKNKKKSLEIKAEPVEEKKEKSEQKQPEKSKLLEQEGQLAVDVYQTAEEIVICSAIAGVKPEDLDISIEADSVFIRGERKEPPETTDKNYFYQECYWGPFFRQVILPEETDPSRAQAHMEQGVLVIRIPKIERQKKRKITVKT